MDITAKVTAELNELFNSNQHLIDSTNNDSINVKAFGARESLIGQLSSFLTAVPDIISRVENILNKTNATHAKDLAAMDNLLNKRTKAPPIEDKDNSWTVVTRKKETVKNQKNSKSYAAVTTLPKAPLPIVVKPSPALPPAEIVYSRIKFTEALSLQAIRVPTFDWVKQDGELYYVDSSDHFAFKLCGKILHGNIGVIYTEEKNPEKIKDCKFASSCMKLDNCDYYHDPVKFPGSKDHRNFIASSWLYAPPNSQYKNRPRSRRFGSRDHLDTDIVGLQEEEISRFQDQTMHDLLCSLLLTTAYASS
jgi:hypothetical protein